MNTLSKQVCTALGGLAILGLFVAALSPRAKSAGGAVPVQVTGTASTTDVDSGARQPIVVGGGLSIPAGVNYAVVNYTVPANQRLVVHSVNAELSNSNTTFPPINITLVAQTAGATNYLYYPFNTGVGTIYLCNQPTALVADPGSTVQIQVSLSALVPTGGYASCRVSLLGDLEPGA